MPSSPSCEAAMYQKAAKPRRIHCLVLVFLITIRLTEDFARSESLSYSSDDLMQWINEVRNDSSSSDSSELMECLHDSRLHADFAKDDSAIFPCLAVRCFRRYMA